MKNILNYLPVCRLKKENIKIGKPALTNKVSKQTVTGDNAGQFVESFCEEFEERFFQKVFLKVLLFEIMKRT